MPAKIMRFFKKPSGILAVLMAVALLGTSSLYAMRAFAEGDVPTVPDDILASNYTQVTVDHMFGGSWYKYVQIYCSEAETVEKELSYRGSASDFSSSKLYDGENPFDIYQYDSDNDGYVDEYYSTSSLRYTGEIPGKMYYVYQEMYDDEIGTERCFYVGSFDINQYEPVRDPRGYSESKNVVMAVTLDTTGAECEIDQNASLTISDTPAEIIHHKDPITTGQYDSETGQWVEVPVTEPVWNEETEEYEEVQLYDEYDEYNFGESLPNSHSEMLAKAGVVITDDDVTLSFFGRKERTYYKYGNRIPISQDSYLYASNIPVIVPNGSSKGSEVFIGFLDEWSNDSDAIGSDTLQSMAVRSVTGILGIPGDAGTVITYEGDYGKVYLPVKVNLTYDNSSWESVEHAFIRPNDVSNGTVDTEYDNTTDSCMIDGGLKGNAYFQLHNSGGTPPQMFYDENDEYSSAGDIPETTWNDNQLTQTTSMWQLAGDDSTTFSVNGTTPIKNIFKENQYTVSGGPVLTFNVNLKSQFRIPGTYSLVYNLNKPKPSLTVTNEASFATVENITKGLVKNGEYTLAGAKPEITGYTFKGWTLNGQSGKVGAGSAIPFSCFDNDESTATATANWEINKHKVTYYVYGEKPEEYEKPADLTNVEFDTEVTVADVPSYDGYSFSGWTVSGATPDENGKFNMPDTDVTIYGTFTEFRYDLDYFENAPDGKTVTGMPQNGTNIRYSDVKDGTFTLSTDEPDCGEGYRFIGWKLNKTSGNQAAGAAVPFENFDVEGRTATATAQWEEIPKHNVTYTVNKPANSDDITYTAPEAASYYEGTENISVAAVPAEGTDYNSARYSFNGWNTSDVTVTGGKFTMPTDNVNFTGTFTKRSYSVSYSVTGAPDGYTTPTGDTYEVDVNVPVASVPAEGDYPGYTFTGWKKGDDFVSGSFTMPAEAVTLTGVFEKIPYHVTYSVTGAPEGYNAPTDNTAHYVGDGVTVEATPNIPGYSFTGWKKDGTVVTSFNMPAENVELTGSFTKNPEPEPTYTIHYHANGRPDGHYSDVDVNTSSVPADAVLNADDLEDGYTLTGSYGSDDAPKSVDGEYDFVCWCRTPAHSVDGIITTAVLGDFGTDNVLDVYAVWIKHVEVEYDKGEPAANVGGIVKATEVFDLNIKTLQYTVKSIEELGPAFRFDNYKFDYWLVVSTEKPIIRHKQPSSGAAVEPVRTNADGSTETITVDGKLYHGDKLSLEGDVKLTAIWKSKITLTYNANGGSPVNKVPNQGNPIEHWTYDTVTVQSGDALKNGDQVFKYWSTTANDETGSKHYKTGNTFTITENTVLYAIYDDAPGSDSGKEYTVTYDKNGGTGTEPKDENKYSGGETVTVKDKGDLVRTDCTFKEWNTKKDGTGTGYKGDGTGSFTMPESDVTLYAIWTDSNGNIVSPGTGESDVPMMIAINLALLSMVAVAFVVIKQQIRRKETAK